MSLPTKFLGVEMSVARVRALTHMGLPFFWSDYVEMSVARVRALTPMCF